MAKKSFFRNEKGQLTIFLGIIMVIVMGLLAFIINVGLFVKAKINLQNAVDAAAWSGAATQARQLTNIGYVNWEIRNTFKEWMFKYYVLGQMGLMHPPYNSNPRNGALHETRLGGSPGPASFLLENAITAGSGLGEMSSFDKYNVPSICIHNNTSRNICALYALPGLPRFGAIPIAGISEIHESFVNKLVQEKAADCSSRSQLNYITATSWAYSTGVDVPGAPLIAGGRIGAWPQAMELALRMRNLEMIMNRPPVSEGIDASKLRELETTGTLYGYNERPLKAFYSAYRNLGGSKYKDSGLDEMVQSFKLYELQPTPYVISNKNASSFLIPENKTYPGTSEKVTTKYYVDLQVYTVNYATMFSSFVSLTENFETGSDGTVLQEGNCGVTKTALPVPGYIMGFVKNPELVTYYAVKGEAKFIGLFYPFKKGDGITLKTYAAAKPFGGRVGPMLFKIDNAAIKAREDDQKRSSPFASIIDLPPSYMGNTAFRRGDPIPADGNFWARDITNIGGIPGSGESTHFTIPNMIYDFTNGSELAGQCCGFENIQKVKPAPTGSHVPTEKLGLHDRNQLRYLQAELGSRSQVIQSSQLEEAFAKVRKPTRYDVTNYLVPDFRKRPDANVPPAVIPIPPPNGAPTNANIVFYRLFAPLIGDGLLYNSAAEVEAEIRSYLISIRPSIMTYITALHSVASAIKADASRSNPQLGDKAAKEIHAGVDRPASAEPQDLDPANCKLDIASRFWHFFTKDVPICGIEPLPYTIAIYLSKRSEGGNTTNNIYYQSTYYQNDALSAGKEIYSAYYPGPRQGAEPQNDGMTQHPLKVTSTSNSTVDMSRNFYSTKFISIDSVVRSGGSNDYEEYPAFKEKPGNERSSDLLGTVTVKNLLPSSELSEFRNLEH